MNYSYTQVAPFLPFLCRGHRYELGGEPRRTATASLWFGRAFERALAALFRHEDPVWAFYQNWSPCRRRRLIYLAGDNWDSMLRQGTKLLERFVQDGRVGVPDPIHQQQSHFCRRLASGSQFVAVVDAIGKLDGLTCLLEWKTASRRYPVDQPDDLAFDPQLLCYSWVTGTETVAQVVFARSRPVEVQYLQAVIKPEMRRRVSNWIERAVSQLESGVAPPQNNLVLAHNNCSRSAVSQMDLEALQILCASQLRPQGIDLGLFDELTY